MQRRAPSKMAASVSARAVLGCLPRKVNLHQHLQPSGGRRRGRVDPGQQVNAVDRMDQGQAFRGSFGLVRLQVPDEMPANGHIGTGVHLL